MIKGDLGLGKFVLQRPLSTSAVAFDFASLKKAGYGVKLAVCHWNIHELNTNSAFLENKATFVSLEYVFLTHGNQSVEFHQTDVCIHFYVLAQLRCWLIISKHPWVRMDA